MSGCDLETFDWNTLTLQDTLDAANVVSFVPNPESKEAALTIARNGLHCLIRRTPEDELMGPGACIFSQETFKRVKTWAEDTSLNPPFRMSRRHYYYEWHMHLGECSTLGDRTWVQILNAIESIGKKHGCAAVYQFLIHLWDHGWITSASSFGWILWLVARTMMLSMNLSEFKDTVKTLREAAQADNEATRPVDRMIARAAAQSRMRDVPFFAYSEAARIGKDDAEVKLKLAASESKSQQEWIRRTRQLWPEYAVYCLLLLEAQELCDDEATKTHLSQEHRFVDERQADIRGIVWGRQHLYVMNDLHRQIQKSIRAGQSAMRMYKKGRVALPDYIWDGLLEVLNASSCTEECHEGIVQYMRAYYESLSIGQELATSVAWGQIPPMNGPGGMTLTARLLHELAHAEQLIPGQSMKNERWER